MKTLLTTKSASVRPNCASPSLTKPVDFDHLKVQLAQLSNAAD
jgi:hypothetical protein